MNFVIPMAGYGARFSAAGFTLPKMLLEAHGKTLLQWSLASLPLELAETVVFVGLQAHEDKYRLSEKIKSLFPDLNSKFLFLKETTRGQAETVYMALHLCERDEQLLIYNIDTYFYSPTLKEKLLDDSNDGVLSYFTSYENRFSFAAINELTGYVTEVKEKEVISSNALTGLYTFKTIDDFASAYIYHADNEITTKGEYYIAPMYNYLIGKGKNYILDQAVEHHILGTPDEYNHFKNIEKPEHV